MAYTITPEQLRAIAGAKAVTGLMTQLSNWMNITCPGYGIDTPKEYAHFLAQACHETAQFSTLRELGNDAYFRKYEGRADLGNTIAGDGLKFKGRGIFQTTGRSNYKKLSLTKGVPGDMFVRNPVLLEQPENAVWSACEYWKDKGLNDISNHADTDILKKKKYTKIKGKLVSALIDVSPVEYITRSINGGINGLPARIKYYQKAKTVLV